MNEEQILEAVEEVLKGFHVLPAGSFPLKWWSTHTINKNSKELFINRLKLVLRENERSGYDEIPRINTTDREFTANTRR